MKTILKLSLYIILPVAFTAILYLMIAFFYVDLNPKVWEPGARYLMSICTLVIVFLGIGVAYNINSND